MNRSKEYRMSELVIRSARSLLLLVQNENSLSGIIERLVEARFRETSPEMAAFSKVLEEFDAYAVSAIGVPYEARTQGNSFFVQNLIYGILFYK